MIIDMSVELKIENGSVRAKVDSSDIMNLTLSKDLYGIFVFKCT